MADPFGRESYSYSGFDGRFEVRGLDPSKTFTLRLLAGEDGDGAAWTGTALPCGPAEVRIELGSR